MAFVKLTGLLKQGWKDIPEVLLSAGFAAIGISLGTYKAFKVAKETNDYKMYRFSYTVLRPDDPEVPLIAKYGKLN